MAKIEKQFWYDCGSDNTVGDKNDTKIKIIIILKMSDYRIVTCCFRDLNRLRIPVIGAYPV